jgi:amino acid permease
LKPPNGTSLQSQKFMSKFIYAIATLSGTIIGVGLFSLPHIATQVGIGVMLGYFLILGSLVILIHYLFGGVALKTPDYLRLPGYAKIYLGDWGKRVALISTILGFLGAILAYIIVGGQFLSELLSPILGGNNLFYTLLYFFVGSILIFFGIKAISKIEFWGLILFFVILFLIFIRGREFINVENLFIIRNLELGIRNWFLPYGPILFSLWGAALIPEVEEMLGEQKHLLKKIIPIAILIPIFVYLFFIFLITGITGSKTTPEAITGLRNFLGDGMVGLGLLFGILTTFTSFIALGLTLKKTLWYDLKIPKNLAFGIAVFLPLFLFLIGMKDFIGVISFVGGVMLGIDGILILLMYKKINPQKFWVLPLILVLLGGIVYEIIYFIR